MKRLNRILFATLALAGLVFASCTDKEKPEPDSVKTAGTFTQAELGAAVQTMYAQWTKDTTIPETLSVADKSLNQSEYFYAMAKFVTNVVNGDNSDIAVKTYKAASHPERDSYDSKTIAVVNGPKDGNGVTEDLATIAAAMLKEAEESAQIPNRALVYKGSEALAFSTNRAIVCFARAIDAYVADGAFPSEISTDYLSANATLKAFAQEFVSYLDVWEANVAETLSADGSRCSDNKTAWENVHFIPIPHSGGNYADGVDQYQDIYKPYHTITVDGVEYSAAQCWVIAMKGLLDICTLEGSKTQQTSRNEIVHTLGNGESMSMAIPTVED